MTRPLTTPEDMHANIQRLAAEACIEIGIPPSPPNMDAARRHVGRIAWDVSAELCSVIMEWSLKQ